MHTGWAPRGERCYALKKAEKTARYNITAALNEKKLFAPFLFQGYSNQEVYATYIEHVLIPSLEPGMFLVIDNASFHKSQKIIDLVQNAGCEVIFLPPYSPDLNPIEHYWSAIKQAIRTAAESANDFYDAAVQVLCKLCKA